MWDFQDLNLCPIVYLSSALSPELSCIVAIPANCLFFPGTSSVFEASNSKNGLSLSSGIFCYLKFSCKNKIMKFHFKDYVVLLRLISYGKLRYVKPSMMHKLWFHTQYSYLCFTSVDRVHKLIFGLMSLFPTSQCLFSCNTISKFEITSLQGLMKMKTVVAGLVACINKDRSDL